MTAPVPATVRECVDLLHQATGVMPHIDRTDTPAPRWRLRLANDRVLLTMDFRPSGGRRWVWRGSTLSIDRQRVEPAENLDHFLRVFANPDQEYERRTVPPPTLETVLQARPVTDAPALVAKGLRRLARRFGTSAQCAVGTVGSAFWAVEVHMPKVAAVLRVTFHRAPDGSCHEIDDPPFLVTVDGKDVTAQMGGKLERVLAMLNRPAHDAAPAPQAVSRPAGPARDVGVEHVEPRS